MRKLRTVHLYLGALCAPLLIFFLVTGAWQMFELHHSLKDGSYVAPRALAVLSDVHTEQRLPIGDREPARSVSFRWVVLAAVLGLVTTTVLGLVMAFRFAQNRGLVWLCLAAGTLVPVVLLLLAQGPP